jgi:GNAT superfamily N-acetyltransferase
MLIDLTLELKLSDGGRYYMVVDPDTDAEMALVEYLPNERWPEHYWSLMSLRTPYEARRKGGATRVLQEAMDVIDQSGLPARLGVGGKTRPKDMTTEQLLAFYGRFGFVEHETTGPDPRMVRAAK